MKKIFYDWCLLAIFYVLATAVLIFAGSRICEGNFTYPLDDTYIHLEMGKKLATTGTWGFNAGEFASASSSLCYTLSLAFLIFIFGSNVYIPLILNLIVGLVIIYCVNIMLEKEGVPRNLRIAASFAFILFTPLVAMTISGMEHNLQILIDLLYLGAFIQFIRSDAQEGFIKVCILAFFVVLIRFEGVFFLPVALLYLMAGRNWSKAFILMLCFFLPIVIFGIISIQQGSYFVPNSLIIKGERPGLSITGILSYSVVWIIKMIKAKHMAGLFVLLSTSFVFLIRKRVSLTSGTMISLITCLIVLIEHLTLAKTGWFFRYESYLVALSVVTMALVFNEMSVRAMLLDRSKKMLVSFMVIILLVPVVYRSGKSFIQGPVAMRNIYEQQIQMARFINRYYKESSVAANDIGAITFFNNIKLVDIYGLGSIDILKLKVKDDHNKKSLEAFARNKNVEIAIIYDDWFVGRVPDSWIKVEKWTIGNNVVCAFDNVSIYAVRPSAEAELRKNLFVFDKELPRRVKVDKIHN